MDSPCGMCGPAAIVPRTHPRYESGGLAWYFFVSSRLADRRDRQTFHSPLATFRLAWSLYHPLPEQSISPGGHHRWRISRLHFTCRSWWL